MGHKLITQIILIATSLVLVFAFIRPAFDEVTALRDELLVYSGTIERVGELNSQLNRLNQEISSFSPGELYNLERFIPSTLDGLAVMKDISYIVQTRNGEIVSLTTTDESKILKDVYLDDEEVIEDSKLTHQDFELEFKASYVDMKEILRSFESNDNLLEVMTLSFSSTPANVTTEGDVVTSDGTLTYTVVLRSYALSVSSD